MTQAIKTHYLRFTLMLAVLPSVIGCDPDWPSAYSTSEVQGWVTLDGQPLADAKVVFIPQRVKANGQVTQIASGITNNRGEFSLAVDSDNPKQIPHDRYRVIISQVADGRETLHRSYNRESRLTYELKTQEAFDRPEFELIATGTL